MSDPGVAVILYHIFLSPNFWALSLTAVAAVAYGAYRSLPKSSDPNAPHDTTLDEIVTLEGRSALMFPIAASASLLLFYYFFSAVSFVVSLSLLAVSANALVFCATPVVSALLPTASQSRIRLPFAGPVPTITIALYLISATMLLVWLMNGSALLNNAFGFSLCVFFIATLRVPSLKIATVLLSALFVYDIFWVFYSARIWKESVMVKVATQPAENPVHTITKGLGMPAPTKWFTVQLQLPIKIIWGHSILGLGDIAIPGVLLAYYLRYDYLRKGGALSEDGIQLGTQKVISSFLRGYFAIAVFSYHAALTAAFLFVALTRMGQPALLYIVPAVIIPPFAFASWRGDLVDLWSGSTMHQPAAVESPSPMPDRSV